MPMAGHAPITPIDLRHTSLLGLITPEFRGSIVAHVLNHKGELPNDVRRKLDSAINSVVKIPQFPNQPAIAPTPLLKQFVLGQLAIAEPLANAVFQAWFASQDTLYAIVKGYLYNRGMDVEYPDFVGHKFRGTWACEDWISEREGLLAIHADLDEDDVALMLCLAADKVPDDRKVESTKESDSMNYDALIQARRFLELLPAGAPEWTSNVPEFLTAVNDIADRKKNERESVEAVQALNTKIAELGQHSNLLGYLELDLSAWVAPVSLSSTEIAEAINRLAEFGDFLERYDPLPPIGSSFSETQLLREEHDAVTRRIQELKSELDDALSTENAVGQVSGESTPDYSVQTVRQEPHSDWSLSDIRLSDGTLDFTPIQKDYAIDLDNRVESLVITPTTDRIDSTVRMAVETPGGERVEDLESDGGTFVVSHLDVGQTVLSIEIVAGDLACSDTYTLAITRAPGTLVTPTPSNNASLEGLQVLGTHLEFTPGVTRGTIYIAGKLEGLTIIPDTTHAAANVVMTAILSDGSTVDGVMSDGGTHEFNGDDLGGGDITLHVKAIAEDNETTQIYTVVVKRKPFPDVPSILWSLVAQDDLAGAYLVAKSMEVQGSNPPVPSQVLKALQGERWLSSESDTYVVDLFEIVGEFEVLDDDDAQTLLRLSASLLPSLIAPETNLLAWLRSPSCLPVIESIVSPIRLFATAGNPLRPEHITGDEGLQRLHGLIMDASADARKWMEEAPHYQTKFSRAVRVWHYLCREGLLNQMLTPVLGDRREQINTVQDYVNLLNRDGYAAAINQAESLMGGRPSKQGDIVGNARDWLVKRIEEAKGRATTWCNLVSREASGRPERSESWRQEQVSSLRSELQTKSPVVYEALLELGSEGNTRELAASARCAMRSLQRLADYLNIEIQGEPPEEPSTIVRDLKAINLTAGSGSNQSNAVGELETAISRRLLWVPSVELDDAGFLASDESLVAMAQVASTLHQSNVSLENAIQSRLERRDFRFFDTLTLGLPRETLDRHSKTYLAELGIERKTLQDAIDSTQAAVDQAEKDGVIEFEGSQWNRHQYTLTDVVVEAILNFKPVYDALEAVKNELRDERRQRAQELMEEWQTLIQEPDESIDFNGDFLKEVSSIFQKASSTDSLDIRVMEDCVSRMRNHRSGEEIPFAWNPPEGNQPQSLEEFLKFYDGIPDPRAHVKDSNGLNNLAQKFMPGSK